MKNSLSTLLILVAFNLHAQQNLDLEKLMPKRFRLIDKVEILVGPNLNIPNDHGYSKYISATPTQYPMTDIYKSKIGYFGGIGLIHSFGKRFELSGRILWERKGYYENQTNAVPNRTRLSKYDERIDYATVSLIPRLYLGKKKQWHFIVGASYSKLLKVYETYTEYINGQLNQHFSSTNTRPDIKNYSVDVIAGIGYSLLLIPRISLAIQLTDNYGLVDVINVNQLKVTNQSINLSLILIYHRNQFSL